MPTHRPFTALLAAALLSFVLAGAFASSANAQATRTWVSGGGDDANPCSRSAPCKTFAGAISKTAARGEINALDPGGFGGLTITKSITVDAREVNGGVLNANSNGIVVNAAATDDVILRGLDIHGAGVPGNPCGYGGLSGVRVLKARSVRIEDTTITQQQKGIELVPTTPVDVFVNRVDVSHSCANGILAAPGAGGSLELGVRDSTIAHSATALTVADRGSAWLTGTTLFGNALGYATTGAGTIADLGANQLIGNAVDGTPSTTADLAGPSGPAGPPGPAGQKGDPGVQLLVTAAAARLEARAGRRVALRYLASAPAAATLTVARAGKVLATVRGTARTGANTIRWNGRVGARRARAGRYVLTLRAVGTDGQATTATAKLKLQRRR